MKALWLEEKKLTYRESVPAPGPGPGEALVRVRLAGICVTDLELLRGYYPFTGIPGHEFVGEVIALGEARQDHDPVPARVQAPSILEGTRVVGEINIACGACPACRRGDRTHCYQRRVLGIRDCHGAFAERLVLPVENLHPVPAGIPDEAAVFTELLAAALEILEQARIQPSDRVLVIGAGRLGQVAAQVLALTGCDLRIVARHPAQRDRLGERGISAGGADEVPDRWADVVVEASGAPAGFALARRAVRPRGLIVLKSTYKGEISLNLSALVVDEITLIGSRCGPFPPALRLLAAGRVDPRPLIDGAYPLEQGQAAFERASQPGALKILLVPGGTPPRG